MELAFSMDAASAERYPLRIRGKDIGGFYRISVLLTFAAVVLVLFWFGSRYPSLSHKAQTLGQHEVASFIWTDQLMALPANPTFMDQVGGSIVNWINARRHVLWTRCWRALPHCFSVLPAQARRQFVPEHLEGRHH